MADIDVDELFSDPDFADAIIRIVRASTINSRGQNVLSESQTPTVGSIQPASNKVIQRLPEQLRVADMKSFWIKGPITATAPGEYSDILVQNGIRYQVQYVSDWSNWGEGYSEGVCVAERPTL